MSTDIPSSNKRRIQRLSEAMYDFSFATVKEVLSDTLSADCKIQMCHPFGNFSGPMEFFDGVYKDFFVAFPDLERRDYIRMGGASETNEQWVGCAGFYTGAFTNSWLGIPATGHLLTIRFHEFFRFENDRVVEIQAAWDLPDWLRQAGAWPMSPSLGREIHTPGPALCNGLLAAPYDAERSAASRQLIIDMITDMSRHPSEGGPEVMNLEEYWHPRMTWYGPSGIGCCRGIDGFRQWHQIPFLKAMPDRGQYPDEATHHFFADGDFAAVTGWPNMALTLTNDGWLGLPPTGQKLFLRSLDFWRIEKGLIRENWVLVDLLDMYAQLGIDVLDRAKQMSTVGYKKYNVTYPQLYGTNASPWYQALTTMWRKSGPTDCGNMRCAIRCRGKAAGV